MIAPRDILQRIHAFHQGQHRAISGRDLAAHFGVRETKRVRDAVRHLRRQGYPICSDEHGYWWPLSREDAMPAIHHLTVLFRPLRESYDGFLSGLDREFGPEDLFSQVEQEVIYTTANRE